MPDKKLTDSEIVKAWEYCATKGNCSSCFLKAEEYCTNILKRLTIDLFNRLQEKNKNLQERNVILRGLVDTQKAENERLKKGWKADVILTANVKAEAYKECIEKVKEKSNKYEWVSSGVHLRTEYTIGEDTLDNLLKELVGEGGGNK